MKITYISSSIIPSFYANSVHVMKMCNSLAKCGVDVTLICKKNSIDKNPFKFYNCTNNFKIKSITTSSNRLLRVLKYLLACIHNVLFSKNIIYARYILPLFPLIFLKKKIILEFHNEIFSIDLFIARILLKKKNCLCGVFITQSLRDVFVNKGLIEPTKAIVLSDACDDPHFNNIKIAKNDVGYVGHLYAGRGIDLILDIANRIPNTKFHIIGGSTNDINYWREKAPENVIFHGSIPHSKLYDFYSLFGIALAPYQNKIYSGDKRCETSKYCSPMKLFEYMAFKKAIICSNLNSLQEVGNNNIDLIYTSPINIDEWIKIINQLQTDDELYNNLTKNAYSKFYNNYTWDKRAEMLIKFIS